MRSNLVKQKLAAGEPVIGTWLTLGHVHSSRLLARLGFDWLTLDVEHSPYDWREIASLLALIADAGCAPFVRVPDGSHTWIKRALDAGAHGIVVPMVETGEQARAAIAAAKYPPEGNRSAGGGMHNLNFECPLDEYYQRANQETVIVLQTESPLGVKNASEIYSQPGCDAIFVGPVDLKFQMRSPEGDFPTAEEHEAMVQQVISVGKTAKTPTGMHVMNVVQAKRRIEQGMQFIAVGSDLGFLTSAAQQAATELGLQPTPGMASY